MYSQYDIFTTIIKADYSVCNIHNETRALISMSRGVMFLSIFCLNTKHLNILVRVSFQSFVCNFLIFHLLSVNNSAYAAGIQLSFTTLMSFCGIVSGDFYELRRRGGDLRLSVQKLVAKLQIANDRLPLTSHSCCKHKEETTVALKKHKRLEPMFGLSFLDCCRNLVVKHGRLQHDKTLFLRFFTTRTTIEKDSPHTTITLKHISIHISCRRQFIPSKIIYC